MDPGTIVGIVGVAVAVGTYFLGRRNGRRVREEDRREQRMAKFVDDYVDKHQRNIGSGIMQLIPSGVLELKSDSEIREALERCRRRVGKHPIGDELEPLEATDLHEFLEFASDNRVDFFRTPVATVLEQLRESRDR